MDILTEHRTTLKIAAENAQMGFLPITHLLTLGWSVNFHPIPESGNVACSMFHENLTDDVIIGEGENVFEAMHNAITEKVG